MRKLFFVTLACLFAVSLFAMPSYAAVSKFYEASVVEFKGDVKVDTKADGTWLTPWIDMKLMKEAIIKTGPKSSAVIAFDEQGKNVLRIKENTQITIKEASVNLAVGSVLAYFQGLQPGSTFSVKTPTAVCGIRGSGMGVDYINNMTVVSAFEHSVFVQGIDAQGNPVGVEVTIPEGWQTRIDNGQIEPPAELSANEMAIWDAWTKSELEGEELDELLEEEPAAPERQEGSEFQS